MAVMVLKAWSGWGLVAATLVLMGCAVGEAPEIGRQAGLKCVDDSPACIAERKSTLKTLVADPQRAWINERPDAAAYASGVRLFAFKTKKKELSCAELQAGQREADGAAAALRAHGTGLSTAQVSRGVILASEVGRELKSEFGRRCKKA
jgi:hypothetical protein